jgi:hypothetical protein
MTDWDSAVSDLQKICLDTFGIPVTYVPSVSQRPELGGQAIQVMGIFDDDREMVDIMSGGSGGMDAVIPRPVVELQLSGLGVDPMEGDEVVVKDIIYRILDVQPDGHGAVVLVLNRNQDPYS